MDRHPPASRAAPDSHERLRLVSRATNDAVWDWDLATDQVWWNEAYALLFGYTPEETLPDVRSWTSHIHPDDIERVTTSIHDVIEGAGEGWSAEYRFRRRDGSYADIFDRGFVQRDAEGRAVRMIGAMQDISARKAAERSLRESEARFRALAQLSSDWYWEQDENLRFTEIAGSRAAAASTGGRPDIYFGKTRWETGDAEPADGTWEQHFAALERREPFRNFVLRRRLHDGSVRFLSISGEPVFDAARRFKGYRGTGTDVTGLREAEDRLKRFRLAMDRSGELIAIVDLETMRYVDANDALCAALGYSREELLQMHPDEIIPHGREELRATYTRLTAGEEVPAIRSHYLCKDGSQLPYESRRHAVLSDGRWLVVSIARDIRAELAAEEALQRKDAFFRSLIENASEAISATDVDWNFLYVSPGVTRITGEPPESLLRRRFGDATIPDAPALRARLQRALEASPGPQEVRFESHRRNGQVRIHEAVVSKAAGPDGKPIYVIVSRDITDRVAAEGELRKREEEFRAVAENAPDGIIRFDAGLRCLYANSAIARTSGWPRESLLGRPIGDLPLDAATRTVIADGLRRALASGETQTVGFTFDGPRGTRHYHARLAPERGEDGKPVTVLAISSDVTAQRLAERAMAESEARLRSLVYASAEPLLLVDAEGRTVFANPAATALFGRAPGELEGTQLGLPLAEGRPSEVEIVLPNGGVRPAELQFAATRIDDREVLVVSLHDLSERKRFEQHIQHLATHDGLTGLPNRAVLRDRLEQAILHARRTSVSLALLFVDLDQFKLVNDSFGHPAGDALLVEVANRLRNAVRPGDTVARLGGDEFVILLTDLARPEDSATVAGKIAEALDRPILVKEGEVRVTASIGISLYPDDGEDLDGMLRSADAAMYRAKDAGRNGYHYYSAEMSEQARARVDIEAGLRRALEREEFRLHFQPQVELASGRITGVEALLRWEHPERGMIAPGSFIPVAEESGLIVPVGKWALHAACREAAGWTAAGLGPVKVAVNLSARQFWRDSVTELVRAALGESGLPPSQLEVEITESVVARDLQKVMLSLEQLRRMGVSVAIDDFGTGYSSLAYLRQLPIQKLKIDRSFIRGIPDDREATALVGEIIRLAHVLSLTVVAEGVETAEQGRILREAGCEAMQGFLFSRPLPAGECAALIRSGRRFQLDPARASA